MTHGFMPDAIAEPIPAGANDPEIDPCGVILHVAVSTSPDIRPVFTDGRGIESHFYVQFDGTIRQYRSIYREADAQFDGNSFPLDGKLGGFVSVETAGMGAGVWTDAQLASMKRIILWVHSQRRFPMRVAPRWNGPGVGYHALFSAWNHNGHTCPGPRRIAQFRQVIAPWLAHALDPADPPPPDSRGPETDHAMSDLWHAHKDAVAADHPIRARRLHRARRILRKINPFTRKARP